MSQKYQLKRIKLKDLILDKKNPRFAELYTGSDKESDIIEYLLFSESAIEIAEAISTAQEFYEDRPLWVFKEGEKYIVKDGNRRCSAVKALQVPNKYELNFPRFEIDELPVLEYNNLSDLDTRIRLEHNSNLFKKWGRIAKALEIYRLFGSGNSLQSLKDIDSNPTDFIKIATFYHKATEIKGEEFKKLVRDGRGKTGGKTIVFERLFKSRSSCGYNFKRKTSEIMIKDKVLFSSYVNAIVSYLNAYPETTSRTIDQTGAEAFLLKLKPYGFPPVKEPVIVTTSENKPSISTDENASPNVPNPSFQHNIDNTQNPVNIPAPINTGSNDKNSSGNSNNRHSIKNKPVLKRKKIPAALKNLIDECYNLDQNNFANSKTALTRVTFECVLKFIVENTCQTNGNSLSTSNRFNSAFKDKHGNKLPYTNFTNLKTKFTELIIDTGIRKAFEVLDLEIPHQIIHNYRVGAIPKQAKDLCDNLIDLIEFMLQEEIDLLNSIDTSKL